MESFEFDLVFFLKKGLKKYRRRGSSAPGKVIALSPSTTLIPSPPTSSIPWSCSQPPLCSQFLSLSTSDGLNLIFGYLSILTNPSSHLDLNITVSPHLLPLHLCLSRCVFFLLASLLSLIPNPIIASILAFLDGDRSFTWISSPFWCDPCYPFNILTKKKERQKRQKFWTFDPSWIKCMISKFKQVPSFQRHDGIRWSFKSLAGFRFL